MRYIDENGKWQPFGTSPVSNAYWQVASEDELGNDIIELKCIKC